MATSRISPQASKSQYHHFIPQFILRNFAHPFTPPKGKRRRKKNGPRPGDHMLYTVNLTTDTPEIMEVPAKRTFGLQDMYRDFAGASNQQYLEDQLSRLESATSLIIRKIRKSFEGGDSSVWINRSERDLLRKFLFIMKYRGPGFRKRYDHQNSDAYSANDKERLAEYMNEKGFVSPLDVWFDNIKAMLELHMDLEGKWREELLQRIFPDDACWYIFHIQSMYLAFCTPSSLQSEFILTDNCYNIYEGPSSVAIDPKTGEREDTVWTNYHEFSPISPRLLMILRSFMLPQPEEDANEEIKQSRKRWHVLSAGQHGTASAMTSILADLPISKARNSYSTISENRLQLLGGEDGSPRWSHRFCFRFFPVSTAHTNKINTIFLDNSYKCSSIAYNSRPALRESLDYYLAIPIESGFKVIDNESDDPRFLCLKKLERVTSELGSKVTAIYQVLPPKITEEEFQRTALKELFQYLPDEHVKMYIKLGMSPLLACICANIVFLGGSVTTFPFDLDQARRMVKLRIKIDVWSQGVEEHIREATRENLRDLFCQLQPTRVWYYLKLIRNMVLNGHRPDSALPDFGDFKDRPEDTIVEGEFYFSLFRYFSNHSLGSQIIGPKHLCRLMHYSVMNHINLANKPGFDLLAEITLDENGKQQLWDMNRIVFGPSGSICDCGK
jgi:hypothetical protein